MFHFMLHFKTLRGKKKTQFKFFSVKAILNYEVGKDLNMLKNTSFEF